ncbi:MAG: decaprenyl-phosphate phosphoribosyltransferase [Propionibacteriaceae bacterium]
MNTASAPPHQPHISVVIRAMRPKQWIKNVLVLAAPVAAGRLFEPHIALHTAAAFFAFIFISATIYLINDAHDIVEDRLHPKKRFRPIAAGELSLPWAYAIAAGCATLALILSFVTSLSLGVIIVTYAVLQICYSLFLKNQPVIDLGIVATGFLLRAMAGGAANSIELSTWFLLVAGFGSLFMVAGKRYSEHVALGPEAGTRKSLQEYSASYLHFVWASSVSVVIMSYCLWAFEQRSRGPLGIAWTVLSIAPFTLALFRYAYQIDKGDAGAPEDVITDDHILQALGCLSVVLVAVAVFL